MNRKVGVFGRSIPRTVVIALSIFGMAAAFFAQRDISQNATASSGPQYHWSEDWPRSLVQGIGVIDSQSGDGDSFSFNAGGFDDSSTAADTLSPV